MSLNLMIKEKIVQLLEQVKREGIKDLIAYLNESDFYIAPCSKSNRLACEGGLAEHSYNVYTLLEEKIKRYEVQIDKESVIICGLLHDMCKVNYYKLGGEVASTAQIQYLKSLTRKLPIEESKISKKYASTLIEHYKKGGRGDVPSSEDEYIVQDELPLGHGEKSVIVIQNYIKLLPDEQIAIRWHMGMAEAGTHFFYPTGSAYKSASDNSLAVLLLTSDYEACKIVERKESIHEIEQ